MSTSSQTQIQNTKQEIHNSALEIVASGCLRKQYSHKYQQVCKYKDKSKPYCGCFVTCPQIHRSHYKREDGGNVFVHKSVRHTFCLRRIFAPQRRENAMRILAEGPRPLWSWRIPDICYRRCSWRKICYVEKLADWQVVIWKNSPHDKLSVREISPHGKFGAKSVTWRNVETNLSCVEISWHMETIFFVTIHAFLSQDLFYCHLSCCVPKYLFCCDLCAFL